MAALAATFWLAHSQFAGRNRAAVNKKPAKTQVASTVHFFEPERPKDPIEPKEIWVYTQNYTFNGAKVVVENQDGKKVQGQLPLLANMSTAHQAHLVMSSPGNMRDGYRITVYLADGKEVRFAMMDMIIADKTLPIYLATDPCFGDPKLGGMPTATVSGFQMDQVSLPAWYLKNAFRQPVPPNPGHVCIEPERITPYNY